MYKIYSGLLLEKEAKQYQEELLKEAAQIRLANEAQKSDMPKSYHKSKLLAFIGKALAGLGANLEEHAGNQPSLKPAE
ncbi:MAG: hypothetical protein A2Y88_02310 [Chloroflexi bacterium RBG_13_48_10]|nr:MAG: hypothetical protein A2Y88_02310 [Chloroflexi bacterium RBG_13_48_10]